MASWCAPCVTRHNSNSPPNGWSAPLTTCARPKCRYSWSGCGKNEKTGKTKARCSHRLARLPHKTGPWTPNQVGGDGFRRRVTDLKSVAHSLSADRCNVPKLYPRVRQKIPISPVFAYPTSTKSYTYSGQGHRTAQHLSFSKYKKNLSQWTEVNGALTIVWLNYLFSEYPSK